MKKNLLKREIRYCKIHERRTKHDFVRNLVTWYWRCEECLLEQVLEKGFFNAPNRGRPYSVLTKMGLI